MTQVEHIEIIFGLIFEVFRHITQADTIAGIMAIEDDRP
jgi:hypothetical protein